MSPTFRFIPDMYRAVVVDRVKTQTRRVITPQPREGWGLRPGPCYRYAPAIEDKSGMLDAGPEVYGIASEEEGWIATYGPPGTILPVVTTWATHKSLDGVKPCEMDVNLTNIWWADGVTPKPEWAGKSRAPMFFPKHLYPLARQAKVVSVKAERVQEISEEDAIAEGIIGVGEAGSVGFGKFCYAKLWDSINAERGAGQYAWKRNPWVFATTFEMLD